MLDPSPLLLKTTSVFIGALTVLRLMCSFDVNAPSIEPFVVLSLILFAESDLTMTALSEEESVTDWNWTIPPRSPTVCVKLGR